MSNPYKIRLRANIRLVMMWLAMILLASCTSAPKQTAEVLNESDPLIGKIFSADQLTELSSAELYALMTTKDVIYLGETHYNSFQHNIQLQVVKELVNSGLSPTIGFEFFSREQTAYLASFVAAETAYGKEETLEESAKRLRTSLGWGRNRDTDWNHLYPILEFARAAGLPIFGADLATGLRARLSKKGRTGITSVEKLLVPASDLENDSYRRLMYSIYTDSHCGWGNEDYMSRLYDTWLARNQAMAEAIVAAHRERPEQPVVVILGGGHIQYDMATVERVKHLGSSIEQLSIRLLEVARTPRDTAEYFAPLANEFENFGAPYNYIWFTARMPESPDPCAVFNKRKKGKN